MAGHTFASVVLKLPAGRPGSHFAAIPGPGLPLAQSGDGNITRFIWAEQKTPQKPPLGLHCGEGKGANTPRLGSSSPCSPHVPGGQSPVPKLAKKKPSRRFVPSLERTREGMEPFWVPVLQPCCSRLPCAALQHPHGPGGSERGSVVNWPQSRHKKLPEFTWTGPSPLPMPGKSPPYTPNPVITSAEPSFVKQPRRCN